jgi:hypothetical protein
MENKAKETFLKTAHLGDLVKVEYNDGLIFKKKKELTGYISELSGHALQLCEREDVRINPTKWIWESKIIFYSDVLNYQLLQQ